MGHLRVPPTGSPASGRKKIEEVDVTLDDINKKYASLQEEAHEKTRKLKKIWTMFNVAKSELADIEVNLTI